MSQLLRLLLGMRHRIVENHNGSATITNPRRNL